MGRTIAAQDVVQRRLWSLAGQALDDAPVASAPRLYRPAAGGGGRGHRARLLAPYLSLLSRGPVAVLLAAVLVAMLLFVTFDLDRPTRGLVTVPDTAFTSLRASMALPPAAE